MCWKTDLIGGIMVCLDVPDQDIRSQNCPCVNMIVISKVLTLLICLCFVLPLVPPLSISHLSLFNLVFFISLCSPSLHPSLMVNSPFCLTPSPSPGAALTSLYFQDRLSSISIPPGSVPDACRVSVFFKKRQTMKTEMCPEKPGSVKE